MLPLNGMCPPATSMAIQLEIISHISICGYMTNATPLPFLGQVQSVIGSRKCWEGPGNPLVDP